MLLKDLNYLIYHFLNDSYFKKNKGLAMITLWSFFAKFEGRRQSTLNFLFFPQQLPSFLLTKGTFIEICCV